MLKILAPLAILATGLFALSDDASAQNACSGAPAATVGNTTYCGFEASADVEAFLGIQYASMTRTWELPQPTPYDGAAQVLSATRYGPPCQQASIQDEKSYINGDADCLYLNVWVPKDATRATPVMVWIHGGAFVFGAASDNSYDLLNPEIAGNNIAFPADPMSGSYNGTAFAESGVIVVTMNYRLGALGFLASTDPKMPVPANLGLRDQQTAMAWVKQNIAQFTTEAGSGPQTGPVTLFGESAGAMSVGFHLMGGIQESGPLFERAIMESNPMGYYYKSTKDADTEANLFFQCLLDVIAGSVDPFDGTGLGATTDANPSKICTHTTKASFTQAQYDTLAAASPEQVMTAQLAFGVKELRAMFAAMLIPAALPWSPVIDNEFVTRQPLGVGGVALEPGKPGKPYIFGFNDQEGALFADAIRQEAKFFGFKILNEITYPVLLNTIMGTTTSKAVRDFTDSSNVRPYSALHDFGSKTLNNAAAAVSAVINDFAFRCGNFYSAQKVLQTTPTNPIYAYHFAPTAPQPYQVMTADLPACNANNADGNICHTMEIPSVFDTFTATHPGPVKTDLTPSQITPEMRDLQQKMTIAWSNFAKSGDPTRPATGVAQTVFPSWTGYTAGATDSNVLTLNSATEVQMQALYEGSNCGFWAETLFDNPPAPRTANRLQDQ